MSQELSPLPYAPDALEPHISEETIQCHYGEYHAGQVTSLNAMINGTELEFRPLEEIIQLASGKLLAHAAEVWNHDFYWNCLAPGGQGEPTGPIAAVIEQKFGSLDRCRKQFTDAAASLFGAGWIWLVKDINGELEVLAANMPGTPVREALTPIVACDVWEHAYYLDYHNSRRQYLDAFWRLLNWDCVAGHYQRDPRQLYR